MISKVEPLDGKKRRIYIPVPVSVTPSLREVEDSREAPRFKLQTQQLTKTKRMSSFRGKRKDEEEHASDGDSEGHAPPKKTAKRDSSDDSSDDIVVCEVTISISLFSSLVCCMYGSLYHQISV